MGTSCDNMSAPERDAGTSPPPKKRRCGSFEDLDDVRITEVRPLISPALLLEELPCSDINFENVITSRQELQAICNGTDHRLVVIVGPCSIHDPAGALEYAQRLKQLECELKEDLLIIMRVYFEKPRTTVGWKGLINDPHLDGSFKINEGLRVGRKVLLDVTTIGLPTAVEFLDTITPQFIGDLVCWGAIGARTTESQVHRELASGLSVPIGFKNATSGDVQVAIDACRSANSAHSFLSVTKQGLAAIVHTKGNPCSHVILRGGGGKTNFDAESVELCRAAMDKAKLTPRIIVDASHGNSNKKHENQPIVAADVAKQVAGGNWHLMGLMIESNLNAGNQKLSPGETIPSKLKYGVSVTDACIDWATTVTTLRELAAAARTRREQTTSPFAAQ